VQVVHADYFKTRAPTTRPFDMAILNPPYQKFLDARFVRKALQDSLRVAALLLSSSLHNPKRAAVWNASHVEEIVFLAKRPDPFENGNPVVFKPMREYVRIKAGRAEGTQELHSTIVKLA
jgi:hypothetical protein